MSFPWAGPHIVKRIRDAIILNFRRAFAYDTKYTYVQNIDGSVNFDCSKLVINDVTPEDAFFLPSINVMTLSGEEHRFLQEDFFNQFKDAVGTDVTRRGAPMTFSVSVEATALDTITRDDLVDRMYRNLKIITDDLANNGVGIVRTSIRADRKEFRGDRWFYTSGVELHLYAEWIEEDSIDPNTTLDNIKATITTDKGVSQEFKLDF